ncbi:metal-dependent transcriptional regulator [Mangrovibacterium diazotrophicum]|uniref:Transcriptional regulator MntR n=1 Tax=Mangrovibacterium diazotrophicum TaxID=1261403 RepID=A0A419VZA0_9BACT|nr:metal-dependent transcriptional regulator [Mangrovibacterium diazotrophicum]RKD88484.1 DtxR family iron (metal) dependent repressor [Mangrovibacterium diazotrophicum]
MSSIASENFIKAIYKFEQGEGFDTRPGSIAKELGITNAAATDMARKLADKKLIDYEKYKALKLTTNGEKLALNIVRKHRLWETFLHQVFGMTMHEIHREAELLEHLTSDFLADKISLFLGHPTTDPHGDPIPDVEGMLPIADNAFILSTAEDGKEYQISRLAGSDKEFFDFCHSNELAVGATIKVNRQYPKNRMTEIEINGTKLLLNAELTNTIYIKELIEE